MFTTGRIIFTLILLIVFAGAMIYAYRKDAAKQKNSRKDAFQVLAVLLLVVVVYLVFTRLLK